MPSLNKNGLKDTTNGLITDCNIDAYSKGLEYNYKEKCCTIIKMIIKKYIEREGI